ncbi:MAG: hypothetical protein O6927_04525 [Gammaproteobacteria bacterium]|nr:hypothetical protein [Gammaproteobacteria bacterium]
MNSKDPDVNEKAGGGNGGFLGLAGVYVFGMVCCLAGPVVILAVVAGLKAWFNDLHPFIVALFAILATVFAMVWIARRRRPGTLPGRVVNRRD